MSRWGAIFDWDGVIIDSARQHAASWERLAAENRLPLPPGHFERSFGMKNARIIPDILGWTQDPAEIARLSNRKEELYREILTADRIAPLPGVELWLERLGRAGVPCAIGSSTDRANIELVLGRLSLREVFAAIVSAEDVSRGKPDPEVFLQAARALRMPPCDCVVFEDAPVGVSAGKRAGMSVVAVASTRTRESLAEADLVVERLDELTVEQASGLAIGKIPAH